MIAQILASSPVNLSKPEKKSQFRFKKDSISTRMNDFLINGGIPVSIHDNTLVFRDSNRSFNLDGDLLETMTNYDINVSFSNPQDRKLIYEFGKEKNFIIRKQGRKSDRDKSMLKLLKSPANMASGVTTIVLPESLDEL